MEYKIYTWDGKNWQYFGKTPIYEQACVIVLGLQAKGKRVKQVTDFR